MINFFEVLNKGELLFIIFFVVFFGLGLVVVGKKVELVKEFLSGSFEVVFWMINKILKLVLFGVFVFICIIIIIFGVFVLLLLLKLVLVVVFVMVFFVFVILGLVVWMCGINIMNIIRILKSELFLVFFILSLEVVFFVMMKKMENFGFLKEIIFFVILIGYMFNLDGSVFY